MKLKPLAEKATTDRQTELKHMPGKPLRGYRSAAVYIGEFCEEMVSLLLQADRLKTKANAFCPDLKKDNILIECKALREKGETLLTVEQMEKYNSVYGLEMLYAFIVHSVKAKSFKDLKALYSGLASSIEGVYLIDRRIVHTVTTIRKVEKKNKLYPPFVRCKHADLQYWYKRFGLGKSYGIDCEAKEFIVKPFPVYLVSDYSDIFAHIKA